jgi:hypothetical protein
MESVSIRKKENSVMTIINVIWISDVLLLILIKKLKKDVEKQFNWVVGVTQPIIWLVKLDQYVSIFLLQMDILAKINIPLN